MRESPLSQHINRVVAEVVPVAVERAFAPGGVLADVMDTAIWRAMDKAIPADSPLNLRDFTWALALIFHATGQTRAASAEFARSTLRSFLKDERVKFGDARYAWDRSAALTMATEYELDHWEARP